MGAEPEKADTSVPGELPEVTAARRAAGAALATGALDRLQAEALAILAGTGDEALLAAARRTLAGELSAATHALVDAADAAATRLEDQESGSDLEELAAVIAGLGQEVTRLRSRAWEPARPDGPGRLLAPDSWRAGVDAATRHLREARDLLDDGMPADSAAFEVLAARDSLRTALG